MGYEINWLVENRVIVLRVIGVPNDQEVLELDNKIIEMLSDKPNNSVHLLVDTAGAGGIPPFSIFRNLQGPRHPAMAWTVINADFNRYALFVTKIISGILGTRLQLVNSQQRALELLNELDHTLPNLSEILYPSESSTTIKGSNT